VSALKFRMNKLTARTRRIRKASRIQRTSLDIFILFLLYCFKVFYPIENAKATTKGYRQFAI